jgi:hypothetical protein
MPLRIVSYSELDTAKQCPLKHQLSYVERWTKPQASMSALAKGTSWHKVLETHYNTIRGWQHDGNLTSESLLALCREAVEQELEDTPDELADLIWWMYDGYVAKWGTDPQWKILAVEHNCQVRLLTPRGTRSGFMLKMKIDLVVQEIRTGHIKVVDHKSGKDLPKAKAFELDDQFGLYVWGLRQLGKRVFSAEYDAARTLKLKEEIKTPGTTPLDERFQRIPLYRTDKELTTIARETYQMASTRYREQAQAVRDGVDSPRHTDPDRCAWRCDYQEPCLAGRKGLDLRQFLRDKKFVQDFSRH